MILEALTVAPDLPPLTFEVEIGGILGTVCWTAAAYWYRRDVGVALRNVTRRDEL